MTVNPKGPAQSPDPDLQRLGGILLAGPDITPIGPVDRGRPPPDERAARAAELAELPAAVHRHADRVPFDALRLLAAIVKRHERHEPVDRDLGWTARLLGVGEARARFLWDVLRAEGLVVPTAGTMGNSGWKPAAA